MICDLPSQVQLAGLPVPGVISFLLSRLWVQVDSCWLLPRYKYHYCCPFRDILPWWSLWFIGNNSWLRLLILSSPCGTVNANPQGHVSGSFSTQILQFLSPKCTVSSTIRTYLYLTSERQPRTVAIPCIVLGTLFSSLINNSKGASHSWYWTFC